MRAFVWLACGVVFFGVTLTVVYITGWGPRWLRSLEARLFRLFKKRKQWSWTKIDDHLFLGSLPRWPEHLQELREQGVSAVLSLCESWEMVISPRCIEKDCGMVHRSLETPDFFAPGLRDLVEAVAFIDSHVRAGRGVFVHCNGGKGRSSVCVICYLMYRAGFSAEDAFQFVRSKRKIAHLQAMCGIRSQWRAVRRFDRELAILRTAMDAAKHPLPAADGPRGAEPLSSGPPTISLKPFKVAPVQEASTGESDVPFRGVASPQGGQSGQSTTV